VRALKAIYIVGSVFPQLNVNSELHEALLEEKVIRFCNKPIAVSMILFGYTVVIMLSKFRTPILTIKTIRTAALVHLN
jgi:hypothetical protein